jgi:hypothetical protein
VASGLRAQIKKVEKKSEARVKELRLLSIEVDLLKARKKNGRFKNIDIANDLIYSENSISRFFNKKEGNMTRKLATQIDEYLKEKGF